MVRKVLFVVDEFPFPARNGVTAPVANFIRLFQEADYEVEILWLRVGAISDHTATPEAFCGPVAMLPLKRRSRIAALCMELSGVRAIFDSWDIAGEWLSEPLSRQYDCVWASPIRAFALWQRFSGRLGLSGERVVASINDSYALTLEGLSRRKKIAPARMLYWCRAQGMNRIEPRMLSEADVVAVQSRREIEHFSKLLRVGVRPTLIELKNGVTEDLFAARLEDARDLLFVGTLDAFYKPTLHWFVREVYMHLPDPRPSFSVIGKGAGEPELQLFQKLSVEYSEFVEDISKIYLSSKILVAPVFKGYGTINKVLEGMAAGCVVIGDRTAFNGITGFVPGLHGIVVEDAKGFGGVIQKCLDDATLRERIGRAARELMKDNFSWKSRMDTVLSVLGVC